MKQRMRRGREQWESIIGEQAASGLSAKMFCQRESLGLASFYQWRRRLSKGFPGAIERSEERSLLDIGRIRGRGDDASRLDRVLEVTLDLGAGLRLTIRRN